MISQLKIKRAVESCNREEFRFKECIIGGDECVLVTPQERNPSWTQETKFLRSCIYRKDDYYPVSLSFPKFMNWGESPVHFPVPTDIHDIDVVEKLDGSLLCISQYKKELIVRTRGSLNAREHATGHEIEILKTKYPQIFDFGKTETSQFSYIFEWCSPQAIGGIVTKHFELDIYLIGIINHFGYTLLSQDYLDERAETLGLKRPLRCYYHAFSEMMDKVPAWNNGKEGVVVYSKNGQEAHKIKTKDYLRRHYLLSTLNFNSLLEHFFLYGRPSDFREQLAREYDWEILSQVDDVIGQIDELSKKSLKTIDELKEFLRKEVLQLPTRKERAEKILANKTGILRTVSLLLLDSDTIVDKEYRKLMLSFL